MKSFLIKLTFFLSALFFLSSCSTVFKKNRKSVYTEDSEFLKQGRKIEIFKDPKEVVEKKKISEKSKQRETENKNTEVSKPVVSKKNKIEKEKLVTPKTSPTAHNIKKLKSDVGFPFKVGENVVLSASFFGVEAGKITIGVDTFKVIEGKKVYNFYAIGKTSSVFSMFYKIGNKIESLWDPMIKKPVSLAFDAEESKQKYKSRVYFDWKKKKAEFLEEGWSKKKGDYKEKKTWNLSQSGQDIVSAIFYTRTLPLKVGETYPVTVFEDAKMINARIEVDRKEVLSTRVGKLNTIVIKPTFSTKGKFKKNGDISVWLTDDDYRQVVRIESKIKIGTVVASLHSLNRP